MKGVVKAILFGYARHVPSEGDFPAKTAVRAPERRSRPKAVEETVSATRSSFRTLPRIMRSIVLGLRYSALSFIDCSMWGRRICPFVDLCPPDFSYVAFRVLSPILRI